METMTNQAKNKTFEVLKNGTKIKIVTGFEARGGEIVGIAYDFSPMFVTYIVKPDRGFEGIDYDCVLLHSSMIEPQ